MTAKHKCSARIPDMYGVPNVHSCLRPATVQYDGKWYCWQHDPERVAGDKEKRLADWRAKSAREVAKYARIARNARLGALVMPELAALLEQLATHVPYTLHTEIGIATQARALAARIREALALEEDDES